MGRLIFTFLFIVTVLSCNKNDVLAIDDDLSLETTGLREKYSDKVVGSWSHTRSKDLTHVEQEYTFNNDGSVQGHVLIMIRDSVVVKGEKVATDWKALIDSDLKGTWNLRYSSSLKANIIQLKFDTEWGYNSSVYFYSVDSNTLVINSPFAYNGKIEMKRKQ